MRRLALTAVLLLWGGTVLAIGVDPPLPDPAQEARAQALAREVRCLVCQNQSIADSSADLAGDLRRLIRAHVVAGDSDAAIRAFLVARYGDWVLLKPPFEPETLLLWLGPALLLGLGGVVLWRRQRRPGPPPAAPLTPDEQARLAALLDPDRP